MLRKSHFPNLQNGVKGVHVSMVEIKSGINIWWRMISPIEHAQRKSLLKFTECGRPFKLERWRLYVAFDQGLRSIPQVSVSWRNVKVDIYGTEYDPNILMVHMKIKIRSMVQNSSTNPKCREGNFE